MVAWKISFMLSHVCCFCVHQMKTSNQMDRKKQQRNHQNHATYINHIDIYIYTYICSYVEYVYMYISKHIWICIYIYILYVFNVFSKYHIFNEWILCNAISNYWLVTTPHLLFSTRSRNQWAPRERSECTGTEYHDDFARACGSLWLHANWRYWFSIGILRDVLTKWFQLIENLLTI